MLSSVGRARHGPLTFDLPPRRAASRRFTFSTELHAARMPLPRLSSSPSVAVCSPFELVVDTLGDLSHGRNALTFQPMLRHHGASFFR